MERLPKTKYYDGGFIKFTRDADKIKFTVWRWVDRSLLVTVKEGIYTGQTEQEMLQLDA